MKHNTYLCEECLKCRDPNIYCKFRSSCPIWFLSKRKEGLDTEEKNLESASCNNHRVTFPPDDEEILVSDGMTLEELESELEPETKAAHDQSF